MLRVERAGEADEDMLQEHRVDQVATDLHVLVDEPRRRNQHDGGRGDAPVGGGGAERLREAGAALRHRERDERHHRHERRGDELGHERQREPGTGDVGVAAEAVLAPADEVVQPARVGRHERRLHVVGPQAVEQDEVAQAEEDQRRGDGARDAAEPVAEQRDVAEGDRAEERIDEAQPELRVRQEPGPDRRRDHPELQRRLLEECRAGRDRLRRQPAAAVDHPLDRERMNRLVVLDVRVGQVVEQGRAEGQQGHREDQRAGHGPVGHHRHDRETRPTSSRSACG